MSNGPAHQRSIKRTRADRSDRKRSISTVAIGKGSGVMQANQLPVPQQIALLVKALDGAKRTNEALARCRNGDEMVDILLGASAKLGLRLTRRDLLETPPIRDWIWFRNNDPLLTVGDRKPRYQQNIDRPEPSQRKKFLGIF
ncbi:hypothetical protein [Synechococcus sp. UW105]|uniref:hypothetical protein n=2 Tax=unclassified Synechococcus TaxID=2626047 RepID=UPI00352B1D3E